MPKVSFALLAMLKATRAHDYHFIGDGYCRTDLAVWTENFLVNKTVGVGGSPQKHIVIDPTSGNQFLYPGAATGSHTGPKSQTMEFMCVDVGVEAGSGYAATVESYAHSRCEAMCEADSTCGCFSVSADDGGSQPVQSFPVGGRPGESAPAGSSITFFTYNGLPALTSAQKESLNPLLYAFQAANDGCKVGRCVLYPNTHNGAPAQYTKGSWIGKDHGLRGVKSWAKATHAGIDHPPVCDAACEAACVDSPTFLLDGYPCADWAAVCSTAASGYVTGAAYCTANAATWPGPAACEAGGFFDVQYSTSYSKAAMDGARVACPRSCDLCAEAHSNAHVAHRTEDPCFPGDATVVRESGAAARLDELKPGDKIKAADASGALYYDEVSRFSYADYAKEAAFVSLYTAKSALRLTAEHRVPVGVACCSNLKKAKDVAVGETLWLAAAGAAKPAVVTKVGAAAGVGVHNPLMKHGGFPLVDGVVTAFESVGVVKLASLTVPLAEALCEATGTCAVVHEAIALANGLGPRPFIGGVVGGSGLGLVVATGALGLVVAGGVRRASKGASL